MKRTRATRSRVRFQLKGYPLRTYRSGRRAMRLRSGLAALALVAGVLALGSYNNLRVQPGLGDEAGAARIRRSGGVELAFAIAVLVVTAVLVALPPRTH